MRKETSLNTLQMHLGIEHITHTPDMGGNRLIYRTRKDTANYY